MRSASEILDNIRQLKGIDSDAALGALFNVKQSTVASWRARNSLPYELIIAFCVREGISTDNLFLGLQETARGREKEAQVKEDLTGYQKGLDEYIRVPRYEVAASAGGGALVQSEQIVDYLAFKQDWLRSQLGLSPTNVAVISVVGDSMEPYLYDGDLILIDTNVTRIENDAVYVLQTGDSLLVKRIQKKLDGTVIVKSDNERYEPDVFRGEAVAQLRVVGRLVKRLVR